MKKILIILFIVVCTALAIGQNKKTSYTKYVDPFIGTATTGHTYPGATLPFGMVSASPDTGTYGWALCSGYHSDNNSIMGFAQTHMSGTGAGDMGDIMLMPISGKPLFDPAPHDKPDEGYRSRFRKETEKASPGYYSVYLDDYGISAEMTVSNRCAFYNFEFPKDKQTGIIFDLEHGISDRTKDCSAIVVNDRAIKGFRSSNGFINEHTYYFYVEFSEPFINITGYNDWHIFPENALVDKMSKIYLQFESGKDISLKIGLSTVSEEGAKANLDKEIPHWDFKKTLAEANNVWEEYLSKIEVDFANEAQKKIFYTAMYHSLIVPNLITDVDGRYRGWDRKIHTSEDGDYYTNYSLWDTYRAVHPFYNLMYPKQNVSFINSMIQRYREVGQLPINEYGINETYCMIGYHAIPVLAEAIMLNIEGFDYEEAYVAMKKSAMDYSRGVGLMLKHGFIPSELENNSVSKTLEYAYDDWCIAQVAKKLKKEDDYNYFIERAKSFRNLLDPSTGFMRGRKADGNWVTPFDPRAVSILGQGDFTEGNSWQYSFYAPHDMNTLVELMGGEATFVSKLDTLFNTESKVDNKTAVDVTGLIGQYAHGNEPSHHMAYLYNFTGQTWKTQESVNKIVSTLYSDGRDGLCGNDDCGQMSCWYIYSTLGFYPVTPAIGYYVIGSPSVKSAKLNLPNGKVFSINVLKSSPENIYIQSVKLNGEKYDKSYIQIEDITRGGKIEFTMGATPNMKWGTSPESRPLSKIAD